MHPSIAIVDLSCNLKVGNWANLIIGAILNETPPHEVAAKKIVRASHKAKLAGHKVDKVPKKKIKELGNAEEKHSEDNSQVAIVNTNDAMVLHETEIASPSSSPKLQLTKAMKKMSIKPIAMVHTLDLSRCFIEDVTLRVLCESLASNNSLTFFKASKNHITFVGLGYLAEAMLTNETLTHIDLSFNNLTKGGTGK